MEVVSLAIDGAARTYNAVKSAKGAEDQLKDTYERAATLNAEINASINAMDPADRTSLKTLKEMAHVTDKLLKDLKKHVEYKKAHRVKHAANNLWNPPLPALIEGANKKLDQLFLRYDLAVGTQLLKHVRGVQATNSADTDEDEAERLLALPEEEAPRTLDITNMPKQIRLLVNNDEKQAYEAALQLCAIAEENVDAFLEKNWIKNLVDSLKNGSSHNSTTSQNTTTSEAVRRLPGLNLTGSMALRVLYRLALVAEFETAMVKAGAMNIVSTLLLAADTSDTRAALCAMLARLLVQADHKQKILKDEPSLLTAVVALVGSESSTEKLHAISVVGRVAKDHSEGAEEIAKLKTIRPLINALSVGDTPRMRLAALRALWSLSSLPENNAAVVNHGGVGVIVDCLSKHHSDEMRQLAASMLAWLAQDEAHDQWIGEKGAIRLLVRLLVRGTPQQRSSAVWALAELADHEGNAVKILRESLAVERLLVAFHSDGDEIVANAGRCMTHLAQFAPDKAKLVNELGPGSLVRLLDAGTTDQRQITARVMQFLVQDVSVRKTAMEKGAIQKLLRLVQHRPSTQPAVDALCAFMEGEDAVVETCRKQILAAGGVDILTKILGDCAGYNQAANDLSQDTSDEFASVGKLLLRIAVSKQTLEQVASHGLDIAMHALKNKGYPSMPLRAVAFLAEFTRKCIAIDKAMSVNNHHVQNCAAVFTQILCKASAIESLDGDGSLSSSERMVVYAAHCLLEPKVVRVSTDRTILSLTFLAGDQTVELFTCSVYTILVRHLGDQELQESCAEALYLLATHVPEAVQLDQVQDLKCVVNALEDPNQVVAEYAFQALEAWSKASSNVKVLGCIGANKVVTWALKRGDSSLVSRALEMLYRLPNEDDEDVDVPLLPLPPEEGPRRKYVATVAELLGQFNDEAQVNDAVLKLCAIAEADVDAFLKKRWIKNLVETLKTGTRHNNDNTSDDNSRLPGFNLTSSLVLRVLDRLALVVKFEIAMVQEGALDIVSKLLLAADTSDMRAAMCAMLARLLVQAEHKRQLLTIEPSPLKAVVDLVRNGSQEEKLPAISVVERVAEDHSEGARRLAQLKTIPLLIKALDRTNEAPMRLAALRALWNLSSLPENSAAVVSHGSVELIVYHLSSGESDEMKQLAASMLAWLAQDEAHDQLIGEAGAIPPLVRLLVRGTPQQRNSAVWALAELADHEGNAVKILRESLAVEGLLAAFRSADDVVQRAKAGRCLAWLAHFAPNKAKLGRLLGLHSIVDLLDAGATDQRQNAARVLRFLVENVSVRKTAMEMGTIQKLLRLVQQHPPAQPAVDALCAFVEGEDAVVETCRKQILAAGGVAILTKILGDCAGYNQAANDPSQDKSDEFASVRKLLLRITVSKQILKQVVASLTKADATMPIHIVALALVKHFPAMDLPVFAFLVGRTILEIFLHRGDVRAGLEEGEMEEVVDGVDMGQNTVHFS